MAKPWMLLSRLDRQKNHPVGSTRDMEEIDIRYVSNLLSIDDVEKGICIVYHASTWLNLISFSVVSRNRLLSRIKYR